MNAPQPFRIDVSPDRLTVTVHADAGAAISVAEVVSALRELKLRSFDDGALIEAMEQRKEGALRAVVAAGTPAVDERPAKLQFKVPFAEEGTAVTRVESGEAIAAITAPVAGAAGCDVFGEPIAPQATAQPIQPGDGISAARGEWTASARGNLRLMDGRLCVVPLLDIHGDESDQLSFDGDVCAKGSLRASSARVGGSLYVGGASEAIDVRAGLDLIVKGAVIGKERGQYVVGRDLHCRFISAAKLTATGNIKVQGEVIRSNVTCGGRLTVANGCIAGGEITASGGVECPTIGNATGVATLIEAGADRAQLAIADEMARDIDANRKRAQVIREKIEPLMRHLKNLTPQQREKVTELMSEAGELEEKTNSLAATLASRCQQIRDQARPEVVVRDVIHAGVTIRFPRVEAVISTALRGPVVLTPENGAGGVHVICTEATSGKRFKLPSRHIRTAGVALLARGIGTKAA